MQLKFVGWFFGVLGVFCFSLVFCFALGFFFYFVLFCFFGFVWFLWHLNSFLTFWPLSHSLPFATSFSFPWLSRAGSSLVSPEQGTRSHLQLWAARAAIPQLLPHGVDEADKAVNQDLLFPDPLKHSVISFELSTALLADKTHLEKCKPEAVFLSVPKALPGGRTNPILHQAGASRFCPSDSLQKHSVLPLQTQADIHNLNSSPLKDAGSGSKQEFLNNCVVCSSALLYLKTNLKAIMFAFK